MARLNKIYCSASLYKSAVTAHAMQHSNNALHAMQRSNNALFHMFGGNDVIYLATDS